MADSERNRRKIQALASLPENQQCVDCGFTPVTWCGLNLGVWFCIHCSAVHRQLVTNISQVRSISLDKFTFDQVEAMKKTNNILFNQTWEAKLHKDWQQYQQQAHALEKIEQQRKPQGRRTIGAATSSIKNANSASTATSPTSILYSPIIDGNIKPSSLASDDQRVKFIFDK